LTGVLGQNTLTGQDKDKRMLHGGGQGLIKVPWGRELNQARVRSTSLP
jgi:hypothetical protein